MKKFVLAILFLLLWATQTTAQEKPSKESFESLVESILEQFDETENIDLSSLLDDLEYFYENPLNVNTATEADFLKLQLFNQIQIEKLLEYRQKTGTIFSIFELNTIEGFDRDFLERAEPFLSFEPNSANQSKTKKHYISQQLLARATRVLQEQQGYKSEDGEKPSYEGNPNRFYTRYRFEYGDKTEAGFTAEKDPGEAFFAGSNRSGFDYYSGYLSQNLNSPVRNITVGDFILRSGQGLVLWQGFASGKSTEVLNIVKTNTGLAPYHSTDENRFFRGAASEVEFGNFGMTIFGSSKKRDANLESDENNFTSLQTSGLHRTDNEITDEKSINEFSAGAIFNYSKDRLKIGSTLLYQKFNHPFFREEEPYNLFRFSGESNLNAGIDYTWFGSKYTLFGEAAISKSGGKALLQGLKANLHEQLAFSFLFRHFDKNYQSLAGDAFSENSGNANETGFYSGFVAFPAKHLKISSYIDFYRFPWITYTTIAPSSGVDFLIRADYSMSDKIKFYLRYKTEKKEAKSDEAGKMVNVPVTTQNLRVYGEFQLTEVVSLKSRAEFIRYNKWEKEKGVFIAQDLSLSPRNLPLGAQFRIAWFKTDSYDTRIYAYENDLLYSYSMPAFSGKGFRSYANFQYKFSKQFSLWFKASWLYSPDTETIGSGENEVSGKVLTEVKIQCRYNF
jgi:hypothetical protein